MRKYFILLALALAVALPAQTAPAQTAIAQGGLFGIFAPNPERQAARAARKAERLAKAAEPQGSSAREAIKSRVTLATMNRPKGRLWCVPFARMVSGLDLRGNAKTWWKAAKGVYDRGVQPKIGAVMSFAGSRAMPLGHVAVVSQVVSKREVLLDHANWERNRITLDQVAVDVSAKNDWSRVRIQNADGSMGRVNPVNGFIYQ
jgi:hypothetical protein